MGQAGQGVARADAWGCWACAHAPCRVHRQSIGQDDRDGRPWAGVWWWQEDQRAQAASVGWYT